MQGFIGVDGAYNLGLEIHKRTVFMIEISSNSYCRSFLADVLSSVLIVQKLSIELQIPKSKSRSQGTVTGGEP